MHLVNQEKAAFRVRDKAHNKIERDSQNGCLAAALYKIRTAVAAESWKALDDISDDEFWKEYDKRKTWSIHNRGKALMAECKVARKAMTSRSKASQHTFDHNWGWVMKQDVTNCIHICAYMDSFTFDNDQRHGQGR